MSAYTRHFGAEPIGGIRYRLTRELVWHIGHKEGPRYVVDKGYEFDVSVPLPFRLVFNPHRADFHKAAALHDHMLEAGWSRITAGAEFHNALKADGVSAPMRFAMLMAVLVWKFD